MSFAVTEAVAETTKLNKFLELSRILTVLIDLVMDMEFCQGYQTKTYSCTYSCGQKNEQCCVLFHKRKEEHFLYPLLNTRTK